jgi:glucokinase
MSDWVVGVDMGASKVALGWIDPTDRVVAHRRTPTNGHEGPAAVVERIASGVAKLETWIPGAERVKALGICSPGPVDHETGMIIDPPNLQGLHHTPFQQMLSEQLGIPVTLEHDAKAAALGEFYYGAGRGERSMVYIVVGTGVGAAIIIDGKLHRGMHNAAGEIGHTNLDRYGEQCSCGSRGCVETFASGPWIARRYQRAVGSQRKPGESAVSGSPGPITGELVARLAEKGDPQAAETMKGAGEALGLAIASMAMIINIDLYVIGGSVAKSGELLLQPAREIVPHYAHGSVSATVRIVANELGEDGPILGCGWLARQTLID